ncbi:hypothetical protein RCO28_26705 [Streptomyces sp. LHD-70]|uniref:hypothetical protein n=1 Tax=Streptomyces sp. LHD-70 TaxID=3072140 RepID=UPI00280D7136|nr:hypothetical protein [Streptomyces sp. LHD-70]MDQ8706040.1 hypothetical protein [Streptomyces sp. LHD-70]
MNSLLARRRLAETYALVLGSRDPSLLADVFTPGGRLAVQGADGTVRWKRTGPQELA